MKSVFTEKRPTTVRARERGRRQQDPTTARGWATVGYPRIEEVGPDGHRDPERDRVRARERPARARAFVVRSGDMGDGGTERPGDMGEGEGRRAEMRWARWRQREGGRRHRRRWIPGREEMDAMEAEWQRDGG